MSYDVIRDDILDELADDFVDFSAAASYVNLDEPGKTDEELFDRTLEVLNSMVEQGLILPGELGRPFQRWPGTPAELVDRLRREVLPFRGKEYPALYAICWFDLASRHRTGAQPPAGEPT